MASVSAYRRGKSDKELSQYDGELLNDIGEISPLASLLSHW